MPAAGWSRPNGSPPGSTIRTWSCSTLRTISRTMNGMRTPSSSPAISPARGASTSTRSPTTPIPCPTCCRRPNSSLPGRRARCRRRHDDRALRRDRIVWRCPRVVDVPRLRLGQRSCARRWHAEVEGGEPSARDWARESRPAKTFTPKFNRDMVASIDDVQKVLLDSRTGRRCARGRPLPRRGARLARRFARRAYAGWFDVPFGEMLRDGRLASHDEIAAAFTQAGVDLDHPPSRAAAPTSPPRSSPLRSRPRQATGPRL